MSDAKKRVTFYCVVNRHRVQSNRKYGTQEPVFRLSRGKNGRPWYQSKVNITAGRLVEDREHPLPCGATVWLESEEPFI